MTADLISYEAPFLIFGGLAVALLIAALTMLPREAARSAPAAPALPAVLRVTRTAIGGWAAGIIFASACVLGLVEVVAPLDLDARLGLSSAAIGLLFAASIAVDAVLAPIGGRWGDRRGRRGPALAGLAITGLSLVALASLPGIVGTAIALGLYGAGFSLAMSASVPWLDEAFGERERGLAYGVQNLLYAAGYAVGPVLGGVLLGASGADLAYAAGALALALATGALAASASLRIASSS